MDRTRFFQEEIVDGINQLDHLNTYIGQFAMSYRPLYYRVGEDDLMRPDMISYKVYGTVKYWWLIMSLNSIFDPFNDLSVGQRLALPNVLDIYNFYKRYAIR